MSKMCSKCCDDLETQLLLKEVLSLSVVLLLLVHIHSQEHSTDERVCKGSEQHLATGPSRTILPLWPGAGASGGGFHPHEDRKVGRRGIWLGGCEGWILWYPSEGEQRGGLWGECSACRTIDPASLELKAGRSWSWRETRSKMRDSASSALQRGWNRRTPSHTLQTRPPNKPSTKPSPPNTTKLITRKIPNQHPLFERLNFQFHALIKKLQSSQKFTELFATIPMKRFILRERIEHGQFVTDHS